MAKKNLLPPQIEQWAQTRPAPHRPDQSSSRDKRELIAANCMPATRPWLGHAANEPQPSRERCRFKRPDRSVVGEKIHNSAMVLLVGAKPPRNHSRETIRNLAKPSLNRAEAGRNRGGGTHPKPRNRRPIRRFRGFGTRRRFQRATEGLPCNPILSIFCRLDGSALRGSQKTTRGPSAAPLLPRPVCDAAGETAPTVFGLAIARLSPNDPLKKTGSAV